MKRWTENINYLVPLDYIIFTNVPMRESKYGDVIDLTGEVLSELEVLAAKAVILSHVPLRGREVKFLRKVLGLSLERFASHLGLTSGTVFRWEKDEKERIALVNEIAVKLFVAEQFGVEVSNKFSELTTHRNQEIKIDVASDAAS